MDAMPRPPIPCIERLPDGRGCPEYAIPGKSRCEEHQREAIKSGAISAGGSTPQWRRARKIALERTGYRCERCGKTDAESRAEGKRGLHVHHLDHRGARAPEHDQALLEVRCPDCHRKVHGKKTRPSLEEYKAQIVARGRVRRLAGG
jgi:DNA-directed RNA polymerase subunit RPC12/RpoP